MLKGKNRGIILWAILSIAISVAYVAAGLYLALYGEELEIISKKWRVVLGVIFIGYGIFRAIRTIKRYQSINSNENH